MWLGETMGRSADSHVMRSRDRTTSTDWPVAQ
eukprot:COSAG03_NODE_1328_length_4314_cov_42.348517_6_plen_31_part_01